MAAALLEIQTQIPDQIHELDEAQWQQVEARLGLDTADYWNTMSPHFMLGIKPEDRQAQYEEVCSKEARFFTKVHDAAIEIAERRGGKVTLLADKDFATVEKLGEEWVMRPAFPIAVDVLTEELGQDDNGEERLEVGSLTTRGMAEYREGAPLPGYMSKFAASVNRDFLLSSRELEQAEPQIDQYRRWKGTIEEKLALVDRIVDPRIIEATRNGNLDIHNWFDTKLIILQRLVESEENFDRSFVYIEDFIGAEVINHPQIAGVHVFREQQNITANQIIPAHEQIHAILGNSLSLYRPIAA